MAKCGRPFGFYGLSPVPMKRTCNKCNRNLFIESFRKNNIRRDGTFYYRHSCLDCEKKFAKNRPRTYEQQRAINIKKKFGITIEEWNSIFDKQNRKCAICETDEFIGKGWHTDHDHITKIIRGILCSRCNTMIGQAKENIKTLESAIKYLKEFENPIIEVI